MEAAKRTSAANTIQRYRVRYSVNLENASSREVEASLVLPIPPTNEYQEVLVKPVFAPEGVVVSRDDQYKNQYAVWEFSLGAKSRKDFFEVFEISVKPRKEYTKLLFRTSDYDKESPTYERHMKPNQYLPSVEGKWKKLADQVIGDETNVEDVVRKCNDYVLGFLEYGNPISGLYSADEAFEKKKVDCGGFDTFLATLCMSVGIPARIVSGFWAGYTKNEMHAWVEFLLPDGKWLPADPSVEYLRTRRRTKKIGGVGFLGSDRIALSYGCDFSIEVDRQTKQISILQNPIVISQAPDGIKVESRFKTEILKSNLL